MHLVHILKHIWHARYMSACMIKICSTIRKIEHRTQMFESRKARDGEFHLSRRTDIRVVGGRLQKEMKSEKRELCISVFFLITWLYPEATLFSLSLSSFPSSLSHRCFFLKDIDSNKARSLEKTSVDQQISLMPKNTEEYGKFLVSGTQEKRPQSLSFSPHANIHINRSLNTWENICWLHNDLKLRSYLKEKDFFRAKFL